MMKLSDYSKQFKLYLSYVKPYWFWIAIILVLLTLSELINVGVRYAFKLVVDYSTFYLAGDLTRELYFSKVTKVVLSAASGVCLVLIFIWFRYHILNTFTSKVTKKIKTLFYNHVLHLSYDFHTTHKSGTLITKMTRVERAISGISEALFLSTIPLTIQIIFASLSVWLLHWSYVVIIIGGVSVTIGVNLFLQSKQLKHKKFANEAEDTEGGHISDTFTNMETIKLFGKEKLIEDKYGEYAENTRVKQLKWEQYFRYFDSFNSAFPNLLIQIILITSAMLILNDNITIGDIAFVQATYLGLVGPIRFFMWMFRSLYTGLVDLESITKYLDIKPEITDKKSAKAMVVKEGGMDFANISFSYRDEAWIKNLSLKIKPGEQVALVGSSGSGKSTIVKLLYRLYDLQKGSISIDGQNIKDVTQESLRRSLGIVPQEGVLFDDTIYNNIAFANQDATYEDIMSAMKAAQLDKVVKKLPKKEHTIVGERGVRLSGGERQRVAIARALLVNAKVLVLDEATSALDSETEYSIQQALKVLLKDKTAIIIAHRLSTIMHADRIIVMDEGKVIEDGSHDELLKRKGGRYAALWNLQKDGFIE